MTSETGRYDDIAPGADRLAISAREVARLGHCGPAALWTERTELAIASAVDEARRLIRPRARSLELPVGSVNGLFTATTPVESIARRGRCWVFVATVGAALEARVRQHFEAHRYLEGVLLDAAGSTAVEAVCDLLQAGRTGGESSARFSPGYCSWPVANQPALFRLLKPDQLGVRLLPSMLMKPLKSVTGLIVAAEPHTLQVPPEACADCDVEGCTRRRARRPAVARS